MQISRQSNESEGSGSTEAGAGGIELAEAVAKAMYSHIRNPEDSVGLVPSSVFARRFHGVLFVLCTAQVPVWHGMPLLFIRTGSASNLVPAITAVPHNYLSAHRPFMVSDPLWEIKT